MRTKPVRRMRQPRYPDAYAPEARVALLTYRPRSWSAPGMIAGGLISATLTLALVGCTPQPPEGLVDGAMAYPIASHPSQPTPTPCTITMGEVAYPYDRLIEEPIPVFAHGSGTGAVGCVSVVAPMFLSEEEALAIIRAELGAAGIEARGGGTREEGVLPQHVHRYPEGAQPYDTVEGPLSYEESIGTRSTTVIDIKFVSYADHQRRHAEEGVQVSVEPYDLKAEAEAFSHRNRQLAAFYDPAEGVDMSAAPAEGVDANEAEADLRAREDAAKALAQEELAAQVRDFIAWLRDQGVL